MSVSFVSSDYRVDCNFSNRNFSDLWKLLGFIQDDDFWCGEMSPIILIGRIQVAKKNTVASFVRPASIQEGSGELSIEEENILLTFLSLNFLQQSSISSGVICPVDLSTSAR